MHRSVLVVALVASALILASERRTYWRPFDDDPQESLVSYHAFGFAAANGAGLAPNPVVAREIDVGRSRVLPYPHWPNGFFLVFEGLLRCFGRSETVGRSFAIAGNLAGFLLLLASLRREDPLIYLALPLLLLSGMARDALSFVFVDVALHFWLGVLLWSSGRGEGGPSRDGIFRACLAAALLSNQLIAVYALPVILLRWFEDRRNRALAGDLATLAGATAAVLLGLVAAHANFRSGAAELSWTALDRTGGSISDLYRELCHDVIAAIRLEPGSTYVVAAAWLAVVAARRWRTALLIPSFLLFGLVLRRYVIIHLFTRLPFVFFCLVTVVVATGVISERLARWIPWPRVRWAGRVLVLLAVALRTAGGPERYHAAPEVRAVRASFYSLLANPETKAALARCNAFRFEPTPYGIAVDDKIAEYFFGERVVERIRRGEPVRTCWVNIPERKVRAERSE